MHSIPFPSIALNSLSRDGDLGMQRLQELDGLSVIVQGPKERQQVPAATTKEVLIRGRVSSTKDNSEPQHSIFLCLRGKGLEELALQIPCHRSVAWNVLGDKENEPAVRPAAIFEDDTAIYRKLNEACYLHYGKWKKWISFYGIVDAHEVTLHFLSATEEGHQFRVSISNLDHDEMQLQIEENIKKLFTFRPEPESFDLDDLCNNGWHTDICEDRMKSHGYECIEDDIKAARRQIHQIKRGSLIKECAVYPARAQTRQTLDGLAQRSPILDNRSFKAPSDDEPGGSFQALPGIEFVLGWQTERLLSQLPRVWFLLALIWIVVIIFGVTLGDWSLSVGLGQLVAASVAIMFAAVKL